MRRDKPLVSIGVPVFNGADYLEGTLDSLLGQTYDNIEIVIRDNFSTDRTCDIILAYAKRDSRIRHSRAGFNQGAARNYNAVYEQSRGPYFKWAAADDLLAPTFIEKCVATLENIPDCVLAYPKTDIIDANGDVVSDAGVELDLGSVDPVERYKVIRSSLGECNAVFGVLRSDVLRQTNLIKPYIAADMHLLAELSLFGQLIEVPETLFYRRDHAQASSADPTEAAQANFYDPKRMGKPLMSSWNGLKCDLRGISRAPIPLGTKLRLFAYVSRFIYWHSRTFRIDTAAYLKYACHRLLRPQSAGSANKAE